MMRIVQLAHALHPTDAASRQLLSMDKILRDAYDTAVFAKRFDARLAGLVEPVTKFTPRRGDVIIYHMTTGTSFNGYVERLPGKIPAHTSSPGWCGIDPSGRGEKDAADPYGPDAKGRDGRLFMYYHNITPARYFFGSAWGSWWRCIKGRRDLKKLAKKTAFAWGASEYSRKELAALGIPRTSVLPIVINPDDYLARTPEASIMEKYRDGWRNLIMVGRVVQHKCQDEAIEVVDWYRKHILEKVRLIIVGGAKSGYEKKLRSMIMERSLEKNVLLTGEVTDAQLAAWYSVSDALISMSEHEGFCVPLVEAMIYGLPVFAKPSAAVPETLGAGGILLADTSPRAVAETIEKTLSDSSLLSWLAKGRTARLSSLSYESVRQRLLYDMKTLVGEDA